MRTVSRRASLSNRRTKLDSGQREMRAAIPVVPRLSENSFISKSLTAILRGPPTEVKLNPKNVAMTWKGKKQTLHRLVGANSFPSNASQFESFLRFLRGCRHLQPVRRIDALQHGLDMPAHLERLA